MRLTYPKGLSLRPTSDAVREALFASLGDRTIDCRFGDLYAGGGSVGIEALSRGAASCVFIERDPRCVQALRRNLANTHLEERAQVIQGDCAGRFPDVWNREPMDIVFMDPPYAEDAAPLVSLVVKLAQEAGRPCLLIVQCERQWQSPLPPDREKRYGGTKLLFFEIAPDVERN